MTFLLPLLPFSLFLLASLPLLAAEKPPLLTLDGLADIYYDPDSGEPVVAESIRALDGKRIRLAGYMVPFNSLENLKEFMLMPSSNGCNFCESPALEEMVYVRQPGKKKYSFMQHPIVVTGTLWVKGGASDPPNSTYAQFLYALKDPQVESLQAQDLALVEAVTPRTILKQVCSLLRVRLTRQVTFEALSAAAWREKRAALFQKYVGGEAAVAELQTLLRAFDLPESENFFSLAADSLANWSAASTNEAGTTIYYRDDLSLEDLEHQRQLAMACYELLFQQEINVHQILHQPPHSYDERLARLSLLLGLRQSFSQFYGSIGLIELRPVEDFRTPYQEGLVLPPPYQAVMDQLLVAQAPFINAVYQCEKFQPYTKAIAQPPVAMAQILEPSLYTGPESEQYERPQLSGYPNRLGQYLTGLLLGDAKLAKALVRDGIRLGQKGSVEWQTQWQTDAHAQQAATIATRFTTLMAKREGNRVTISSP